MKLLQVNKFYYPWLGGVETTVRQIAEGLATRGHDSRVLVCVDPKTAQSPEYRETVPRPEQINQVKITRAASWGVLLGMPLSWDFFKKFNLEIKQADVVLLHHPFPLGFLAAAMFRPKKLVVFYHSDIVRQIVSGRLIKPLVKLILQRADLIFCHSHNLTEHSALLKPYLSQNKKPSSRQERWGGETESKIKVAPAGIKLADFEVTSEQAVQSRQVAAEFGQNLILAVGRLVPYKGFACLIEAAKDVPAANFLIIGAGPEKDSLVGLIELYQLADRVKIIEPTKDLRPYYRAAKIFAFPSITANEAFGLVQLEAMAYGLPVVNTDLPTGVPEVSLNEQTGLTVKPGDVAALAQALNKLLNDEELRQQYGQAARQRVEDCFTEEKFIATVERELAVMFK